MLVISPSIRNLLTSHKRTLLAAVFIFLYSFSITLAVPPTTKYQPGATLDPACAPGDTNCSVQILPDQTSNANKYLTTDGSSTAWSSSTLVLGGNFTTSGAYATTLTATGTTTLTLPTSGTLYGTATDSITSSQLLTSLSDETGTGLAVFATAPSFTTSISTPSILTASGALGITPASGSNLNITLSTTGDFAVNTNQLYVDTSTGYVGVGTGSPDVKLHVNGANGLPASSGSIPVAMFELRDKAGAASHGLFMGVNDSSPFGSWIQAQDANALGTNYPLSLNPNGGNVGIGTTSPGSKLTVTGNTANSARLTVNGSDVNGVALSLTSSATNGRTWSIGSNYVLGQGEFTLYDGTAGLSRFTIDSSGNVIVSDLAGVGNRCVYADTNGQLGVKSDDCGLASGGDDMGDHTATQNIILGSNWLSGDGGNEGIKIDSSGNVGIGIAVPVATLDVQATTSSIRVLSTTGTTYAYQSFANTSGSVYLGAENSTGGGIFTGTAAYSGVIGSMGARAFHIATNGIARQTIDSSGNVGIGTTSPITITGKGTALTVSGSAGGTIVLNDPDTTTGYQVGYLTFEDGIFQYGKAADDGTSPSPLLTIDSGGNVGIGTESPGGYKLNVNGAIGVAGAIVGQAATYLDIYTNTSDATDNKITRIGGGGDVASTRGAFATFYGNESSGNEGDLYLTPGGSGDLIVNSGNVGIGTTSPNALLHLSSITPAIHIDDTSTSGTLERFRISSGDIGTTQSALFSFSNNDATSTGDTTVMTINESGGVGIGTTTPAYPHSGVSTVTPILQVHSTSNQSGLVLSSGATADTSYIGQVAFATTGAAAVDKRLAVISANLTADSATNVSGQLVFWTNNAGTFSQKMVLDEAGRLGIGTADPSANLHVVDAGTATVIGMQVQKTGAISGNSYGVLSQVTGASTTNYAGFFTATGGTNNYGLIVSAGNVGIGITNPSYKLVVSNGGANGLEINPVSGLNGGTDIISYNRNTSLYTTIQMAANNYSIGTSAVTSALTISNAGLVGVGTDSASYKLHVSSTSASSESLFAVSKTGNGYNNVYIHNGTGYLWMGVLRDDGIAPFVSGSAFGSYIGSNSNHDFILTSNSVPRITIAAAGSVSISSLLSCGGIQTNGSGTMSCTSDETLKDIEGEFTQGLEAIREINPIAFSWKNNSGLYDDGVIYYGFSAQNVQAALPEAISLSSGNKLQVSQLTLMATAINAIKEMDINVTSIADMERENTWRDSLLAWFADATNGIESFVAGSLRAKTEICIDDVCMDKAQLFEILQQSGSVNTGGSGGGTPDPEPEPTPEEQPLADEPLIEEPPVEEPTPEPELPAEEPVVIE